MSRANFVQVRLAAAATDIQTTLSVKAPEGGLKLPPADGGRLVLTDSPGRPSAFEIISYTSRTGSGPYTLNGVTRGLEGTVGLVWGVDTFAMQTLTVGEFEELLDKKVDKAGSVTSVAGRTGAVVLAKADVGLSNVDNTADAAKPVSTAQQAALNLKVDKAGSVTSVAGRTGAVVVSKADVGLNNVDNTSDMAKPVSTAQQAALNTKVDKAGSVTSVAGRTGAVVVSKADVGLGNVDNTSDANKPVSTAQQAALDLKLNANANAVSATKLATARTIALSGEATGSGSFDGSGNLTISTTLKYGTTAGTATQGNDARLSNSREWTATEVSQAEAEAGTATAARKWTAQRVRQAIAAWWDSAASASGKTVATGTPAQARTALGLGTAALRDVVANSTDLTPGRMLVNGSQVLSGGLAGNDNTEGVKFTGYRYSTQGVQVGSTGAAPVLQVLASRSFTFSARGNNVRVVTYGNTNNDTTDAVMDLLHTGNTTVDSNGILHDGASIPAGKASVSENQLSTALNLKVDKTEFNTVIGNIGAILDAVNGEVA